LSLTNIINTQFSTSRTHYKWADMPDMACEPEDIHTLHKYKSFIRTSSCKALLPKAKHSLWFLRKSGSMYLYTRVLPLPTLTTKSSSLHTVQPNLPLYCTKLRTLAFAG